MSPLIHANTRNAQPYGDMRRFSTQPKREPTRPGVRPSASPVLAKCPRRVPGFVCIVNICGTVLWRVGAAVPQGRGADARQRSGETKGRKRKVLMNNQGGDACRCPAGAVMRA